MQIPSATCHVMMTGLFAEREIGCDLQGQYTSSLMIQIQVIIMLKNMHVGWAQTCKRQDKVEGNSQDFMDF